MALSMGGIIAQALLGGAEGAGKAASFVGKTDYEENIKNQNDAAAFQRQKDLAQITSDLGVSAHAANSATDVGAYGQRSQMDTDAILPRAQIGQDFKVSTADVNRGIAVADETAKATANQPFKMAEIDARNKGSLAVAQTSAAPHAAYYNMLIGQNALATTMSDQLASAYSDLGNATTPQQKAAAQNTISAITLKSEIVLGKRFNLPNAAEKDLTDKKLTQYGNEINKARDALLLAPTEASFKGKVPANMETQEVLRAQIASKEKAMAQLRAGSQQAEQMPLGSALNANTPAAAAPAATPPPAAKAFSGNVLSNPMSVPPTSQGGPLADQLENENRRMRSGEIVRYSPEVQQYITELNGKQSAANNAQQVFQGQQDDIARARLNAYMADQRASGKQDFRD